jgi:hypothetical protein
MSQPYVFALKNALEEIKKVEPCVQKIFLFQKDGEVIAKDDKMGFEEVKALAVFFVELMQRAENIDAIENLTIEGSDTTMNICCVDDLYVGSVFSRETDERTIKALTKIVIPTIIKLVDHIAPVTQTLQAPEEKVEITHKVEIPKETPKLSNDFLLPKPPVNQFIAEKMGGLLAPSDIVRIDCKITEGWCEMYGDREIHAVDLESVNGKTTRCRFKPNKDSKQCNGTIQIPEKIMTSLKIGRGELVMVKPVVELEA